MNKPSEPEPPSDKVRLRIIGLGEHSFRKSYYPELQLKLSELERQRDQLRESEIRVRNKLAAILEPDGELDRLELADVIDTDALQSLMNDFHALTGYGVAIIDLAGRVLVATGWQDICTKFHRVHPETSRNCLESDTLLTNDVEPGRFKIYQCKNHMWDMVTPILVGGKHLGNLFLGQFLFEDEAPHVEIMREQARRYGFDETAYLDAYHRVPRWDRGAVQNVMTFYCNLVGLISRFSYMHIKLARATEELRKKEEELNSLCQSITAKNQELEQIISVISHDLRSPLLNAEGYGRELEISVQQLGEILEAGSPPANGLEPALHSVLPDITDALRHIRSSTRQMDKLLKGLLKLSRMGRAALRVTSLDMNKLIAHVVSSREFLVRKTGAELRVAELPPCRGDEVQITQVFVNLLDNAIKFLDPSRAGMITIRGGIENGCAVYCVEDNGMGIAPEHQENIFGLFHRLDPSKTEGDGMGLPIVRQILGRLNGKIRVESKLGAGSRFHVSLPCAPQEEETP